MTRAADAARARARPALPGAATLLAFLRRNTTLVLVLLC